MAPALNRQAPGLLLSWLLIDASIGVYLWLDGPSSVSRILLAGGIGLLLYVLIRRPAGSTSTIDQVEIGVALLLALELAARIAIPYRPEQPAPTVPVQGFATVALAALAFWAVGRLAAHRHGAPTESPHTSARVGLDAGALAVIVAAGILARFVIVAWDMEPGFDVHLIQQAAGRAILVGENPYLTHVYHSGYPYWPLSAVLAAAGLAAGDARWGLLLADAATVIAFIVIARNLNLPGRVGALLGSLFLWDSSGLYMTWQSLPEPLVIAFGAIGVALLTRPRARGLAAGIAFGLAVATKQLGLGLLPLLPISRHRPQRSAFAAALLVSGVILVCFLALSPAAFIEGSFTSHLVEPSRDYAINLLDPLPGIVPPFNVPFVITAIAALGAGLIVRLRWPDAVDGWLAGTVSLLFVAFSLIGISFLNYYQIPLTLLLILVLIPKDWTYGSDPTRAA
jgi:hypothetical protein